MAIVPLLGAALIAFLNGANDISRSIATLVGAGVRSYRKACQLGTLGTIIGSALSFWLAQRMLETFTKSWTNQPLTSSPVTLLAIVIAAVLWLIAMTWLGIPVSTTHSIVGAIIGFHLVLQGWEKILWGNIAAKVLLPLLFSPLIALALSWSLYRFLAALDKINPCLCIGETANQLNPDAQGEVIALVPARRLSLVVSSAQACRQFLRHQVGITADHLHLLSAFSISVARALNDAPKIAAIGLLAQSSLPQPVIFAAVTLAMGIGSLIGGWRVTKTLAEKITPIDNRTGLSANLTISLLVSGFANLGLPVSTTHVTGGSIVGIGISKGAKSVYWKVVSEIVIAWCVTMPVCGLLSATIAFIALRL
ncbi:MAG: inorganic phosphate transporter [Candidatus Fervidibacter sacchari]